ncbi:MAG: hypothetical protein WCG04_04710 [Alphaproteobacteria bacterium]
MLLDRFARARDDGLGCRSLFHNPSSRVPHHWKTVDFSEMTNHLSVIARPHLGPWQSRKLREVPLLLDRVASLAMTDGFGH